MKALRGNGAFFTDVYLATDSDESLAAASTLAKSAWSPKGDAHPDTAPIKCIASNACYTIWYCDVVQCITILERTSSDTRDTIWQGDTR